MLWRGLYRREKINKRTEWSRAFLTWNFLFLYFFFASGFGVIWFSERFGGAAAKRVGKLDLLLLFKFWGPQLLLLLLISPQEFWGPSIFMLFIRELSGFLSCFVEPPLREWAD